MESRTMEQQEHILERRRAVWDLASEMIRPIIEQHGIDGYSVGTFLNSTSTTTPVDQHIDHTIRVAEWLLER